MDKKNEQKKSYSIKIKNELHQKMKIHCAIHNKKMQELINEMIEYYLNNIDNNNNINDDRW